MREINKEMLWNFEDVISNVSHKVMC